MYYEYKRIVLSGTDGIAYLNKLAAEGWEDRFLLRKETTNNFAELLLRRPVVVDDSDDNPPTTVPGEMPRTYHGEFES